jgi:hypothetical protein
MSSEEVQHAMLDAVEGMQYENMLLAIRHIISLRTSIPESDIKPEMTLTEVFKLAFALEQGMNVSDVYDPLAFEGVSDTQLASKNLLQDMERAFNVHLDMAEEERILTVHDLSHALLSKQL